LHLLKNAVVHGIEPTETRRLLGKEEKGRVRIAVRADETDVYLTVSDDGHGISTAKLLEKAIASGIIDEQKAASMDEPSIIDLIFDRGLTTAESVNMNAGRGVGMSIVKESVESRGGSVTVETVQQKGTRFTVRMPLTLPKPEAEVPDPAPIEPTGEPDAEMPPLVLIVDDSPSIRRMTARIVEDAGFRTITAEHGAEALELLLSGEWEPDVIISDVEMPVMDGWQFLEYVKTDNNFGHIPVVMATSLSSEEYREKASGLGASDYVVKPFCRQELDRVVETLFRVPTLAGHSAA
ncbi:MAG TPA: response regulator, partial [Pyrinomonadaceae bacterium]|nr:response regulator [Pyrinomonadaceae bacterium]